MKKVSLLLALCAALMIAVPAMALEVEVSGHYFIEGFNHSNELLNKNFVDTDDNYTTKETSRNDYATMEFMAKPVFKINDNITLTTQFTALQDHVVGNDASAPSNVVNPLAPKMDNNENFDWKAAYLTIKTPIGGFIMGRYIDTPWGTPLGDSTASHGSNSEHKDRIMWVIPTGDFISGLVAQKNADTDKGTVYADQDNYKFYGFSAYKQQNWSTGLLIARYHYKNFIGQKALREFQTGYSRYSQQSDAATTARGTYTATYNQALELAGPLGATALVQAAPFDATASGTLDAALGANGLPAIDLFGLNSAAIDAEGAATYTANQYNLQDGPATSEVGLWVANPYFMGQFGPLGIEAEILYGIGKVDLDAVRIDPISGKQFDEVDAEAMAASIDLKYDIAGFTFNGGYTYVQGDSEYTDDEAGEFGYFERNNDLEHGFLLTSDVSNLQSTLGGVDARGVPLGNLAGGPATLTGTAGYQMFWLGAKYQLLDNLKLGLLYVNSKADDPPYFNLDPNAGPIDNRQWDDDHGAEYDFTLEWNIMDSFKFYGVVAHLEAGDYWKQGDPTREIKNNTTAYGRFMVEF